MHEHTEEIIALTLIVCLLALFPGSVQSESLVTISGIISEEGQLLGTDGIVYEIADSETGFELMELTGHQVQVTGQVVTTDEIVILVVEKFEIARK